MPGTIIHPAHVFGLTDASGWRPIKLNPDGSLPTTGGGAGGGGDASEATLLEIRNNVADLEALVGEVAASPTANTVLDRLKGIKTTLDGLITQGFATETTLAAVLTELGQKLEPGGSVALDAGTLAALETISVANMIPATETGLAKEVTVGKRYAGAKEPFTATVTNSGDNIVVPAPGVSFKRQLFWAYALADPDQATSPLITVKWSSGQELYRGFAIAHWEFFESPGANESIIVNLSEASSVAVTMHTKSVAA